MRLTEHGHVEEHTTCATGRDKDAKEATKPRAMLPAASLDLKDSKRLRCSSASREVSELQVESMYAGAHHMCDRA